MKDSFDRYKLTNDIRLFMANEVWNRLGRHGFSWLSQKMLCRKNYGNRKILGDVDTNEHIAKLLESDKPCMISRFGNMEITFLSSYMKYQRNKSAKTHECLEKAMNNLCLNAGFFPDDLALGGRFVDLYIESIREMNLCGVWNQYMEDYFLDMYAPNCVLSILRFLEPWNTCEEVAWSSTLAGKKVLVIHPFQDTIKRQYIKNREIFKNRFFYENILPDFDLKTIKAVQSIGGKSDQYGNWFDALNAMIEQAKEIDFDVAIIGCGAYGMPLAASIKKMGKKAVHLGGSTQLMFGIWGHRWDQIPGASELLNEAWVRPSEDEKPKCANDIENGCYW